MNNNPVVAVIIANYNHKKYIKQAIDSIVEQTYPNIIVSITDDASTDDSLSFLFSFMDEIIEKKEENGKYFKCKYKNHLIYISNFEENQKQAAARNNAIQCVWKEADLFMPLDADDILFPEKVEKSVGEFLKNPNFIGLVYSDVVILDEKSGVKRREYRPPYDRELLERQNIISNAPLINRDALGYAGLYDSDLPPCEDWDLWLRITENCVAIHIPEPLQQYTTTGLNCTFTVSNDRWNEQRSKVINKMLKRKQLRGS